MIYLWGYLIIGFIYGLAATVKIWSEYESTHGVNRAFADMQGYGTWQSYMLVFVSRLIAWPVYILMGMAN